MAKYFTLPKYSKLMEEAMIIDLFVAEGDYVNKGDNIIYIETDKASLDVESPFEGYINKILVKPCQIVPIGTTLIVYGDKQEKPSKDVINKLTAENAELLKSYLKKQDEQEPSMPVSLDESVQASVSEKKIPISRLGKITAKKMLQSKATIPCFYLNTKADVTNLVDFREKLNSTSKIKISFNDLIMYAVGIALQKYPVMTGQLMGDYIALADTISIGIAVSVEDGLVVPVVKDVPGRSLNEIAVCSSDLIAKAKTNNLSPDELEGACITISNLGGFGIDSFIPVVLPGQCSIIGVGRITDTCVSYNRAPAVRKIMNLNLSVDHKVVNGADASQFLDMLRKLLENPANFE
ncbi:MAG: 2-oxo acid dehydrogenase subunit E2 [Sedimentisphaerales bacterium]|nr:2-oxo acid dehydrogenase subunit E2 [Sedimentisphaerales bacterium]